MYEEKKLFDSVYTGLQIEEAIGAGLELRENPQLALAKLGGRPNRNLFDNAFFAGLSSGQFPVRQKGDTMDRWGNVSVTLDFLTDGVKVTSAGLDSYVEQKIENPADFAGKTLTISAWVKDISVGAYIQIYAFNGSEFTVAVSDELTTEDICFATIEIPLDTTNLFVRLYVKQSGSATYVAAKCEEGDKQTLGWKDDTGIHLFETPNYGDTLAKCQRYALFGPIYGSPLIPGYCLIQTPVTMRATPVFVGKARVNKADGNLYLGEFQPTVSSLKNNCVSVYIPGVSDMVYIETDYGNGLSAEL